MGWNDDERGELPPPLPTELTGVFELYCPVCKLKSTFDLEHLLDTEKLYCHDCCKAYNIELWDEKDGHTR